MQITEELIERIAKKVFNYMFPQAIKNAGSMGTLTNVQNASHADNADHADEAEVAEKLGTEDIGNTKHPIYLDDGFPTSCGNVLDVDIEGEAAKVPWTGVEDVISGGTGAKNEFNICDATPDNSRMWINYRGRQGSSLTSAITEYLFGNGQGARTNVTVRAYNFFADSALSIVSDARKKEVTDDQMVLDIDAIAEAPSVLFRWRDSDDKTEHVGTIAQYWQKILPQVVLKDKDGMLSMDYSTAALVATISIARELRKIKEILQRNELR